MIIMTFIPHRDTVSVARLADLAAPIQLKVNQVDSDNNHNWSLMSSWYSWGMIITNHQWYWTPTRKKLLEVDADDLSWQMESVAGTSWTICINAPVSSWPAIKIIWIVCIKRLLCQFNISISSNISFSLYFCTLLPEGRRGSAGIQPWCPSEPRRPLLSPCCAKVESICHISTKRSCHLEMKRQHAPKPDAQVPSLSPPLSEHSRGERHTPGRKKRLFLSPAIHKIIIIYGNRVHLAWGPGYCCRHCWENSQCWRGQRTCLPWGSSWSYLSQCCSRWSWSTGLDLENNNPVQFFLAFTCYDVGF